MQIMSVELLIQICLKMLTTEWIAFCLVLLTVRPVRPCSLHQCHGALHGTVYMGCT